MPSTETLLKLTAAAAAAAAIIYVLQRQMATSDSPYLPSKAEQAWLDEEIRKQAEAVSSSPLKQPSAKRTPSQVPDAAEQKWLDNQISNAEDTEMLDDARQAAFAPGEAGSGSPLRPKKNCNA